MIGGSLNKEQRHVIYHFTCCPTSGHRHSKMSWVAAKCWYKQWIWMWTIMWWHELHVMSTILPSGAERTTYCLKSTKPEATPTWVAENIKKKHPRHPGPPHMFPEPTGPQRMSYLIPFTQSSHTRENQYSYIRMLLVDFTSAFNTTSHM